MKKPVVWITQEPMRKDISGRWVSKGLDLASASEYGNTIIIWGPDASIMSRDLVETEAIDAANAYNDQQDYIVALGSPTLSAVLSWAIGKAGKTLRMLEWDNKMAHYHPTLRDSFRK